MSKQTANRVIQLLAGVIEKRGDGVGKVLKVVVLVIACKNMLVCIQHVGFADVHVLAVHFQVDQERGSSEQMRSNVSTHTQQHTNNDPQTATPTEPTAQTHLGKEQTDSWCHQHRQQAPQRSPLLEMPWSSNQPINQSSNQSINWANQLKAQQNELKNCQTKTNAKFRLKL